MSKMKKQFLIPTILIVILSNVTNGQSTTNVGLGPIITNNIPWRAGHASVYSNSYVVIYGGTIDPTANMTSSLVGSNSLYVWDSRNGSWYNPTTQVQGGLPMLPQVYFKATNLPTQGQFIALVANTTNGAATGVIQKLDLNSWSWSFPSSNFQASARTVGYTMETINNTIYTYGGLSVDANGFPQINAIQNTLSLIDTNSFSISPGSNGLGLTGHTTCYLKKCNCLVTFGGTQTGNPTDVTAAVNTYDLNSKVWNVQGLPASAAGSATPGARRLHTANCLDDYMIVYGGGTNQPADTDVWILNATNYPSLIWQRQNMANQSQGPNLRMGHSSVYDNINKKIYIYGGWGVTATNDSNMYVMDIVNWSWTRVPTTGYPPGELTNSNSTISGPDNDPSGLSNSGKMSTGAIVGAAVGAAIGLLALAALLFFLIRHRKRQQKEQQFKDSVIGHDDLSENIQHQEAKPSTDNPFYYNPAGFYNTNDSDSDDEAGGNHVYAAAAATSPQSRNKRMSKLFNSNGMSTHTSFNTHHQRSEIGDSDKVVTGILEALNANDEVGTIAATHGSRSPRDSFRNSKVLLVTPTTPTTTATAAGEFLGQGQVPNEIISQKPNEFSVPAARFSAQHSTVPVDHINQQLQQQYEVPMSASLEVLQSIKTGGGSSMMNHAGSQASHNKSKHGGIPITHETMTTNPEEEEDEEEENWTIADSLSVNHHNNTNHANMTPPIQYIIPTNNSHQLSTANSTQTWDTTKDQQRHLVNHINNNQQQYPSSTLNMPIAQTVTPPTTTNNSSNNNSANTNELRESNGLNIYNTVSPLDALASLAGHQENDNNNTTTPGSSQNGGSSNIITPSSQQSNSKDDSTSTAALEKLTPLINALPRRYQLDKSKKPITGPTNNILFVTNNDQKQIAIKSFGRREAWERECRTLIKLKSPCVVEILEVLTIQGQQTTNSTEEHGEEEEEEEEIKYVTVMERLDETLGTFIRNTNSSRRNNGQIARDVLGCLSWCHKNGIAFCDLKPSNMMHHTGQPWKLIDFEASRTIGEECVGVITPRYCPPEVARATTYGLEGANGVVATASVDLWSLGCVIYELETKRALFASNIKDETILHFISHPSPSTPILNNGLRWNEQKELEIPQLDRLVGNTRTRQLIRTLLSREPSKRGSASQLLEHPYFNA